MHPTEQPSRSVSRWITKRKEKSRIMKAPIQILIVDDDPDFLFLIQKMLAKHPEFKIAGACRSKQAAVTMALSTQPDIVLMDLNLGASPADGIQASREIRILTSAKVLILTALEEPEIILRTTKRAFASGYIFKHQMALLPENISALAKGHTAQEYQIAMAALSELSKAEMSVFQSLIGKDIKLHSSPKTIANQTTQILKKLGLDNKKELAHVFLLLCDNS